MPATKLIISKHWLQKINWQLLVFLIFFLNVKMVVKIAAIILILFFNRRLFIQKNIFRQNLTWFYCILIVIGILNLLLNLNSLSFNYLLVAVTGFFFWLLCIAAALLNTWFVEKTETGILHNTISLFFIMNAIMTFIQLILIMLDAGTINPFTFQGNYQEYFMGTGDKLMGISYDTSTTNALINSFAVIYFVKRSKFFPALVCMAAMLLTASNFTYVIFTIALVYLFIFQSERIQKSVLMIFPFMMLVFLVKVSPQNGEYVTDFYKRVFNIDSKQRVSPENILLLKQKPDELLNDKEQKQKTAMLYLDSVYNAGLLKNKNTQAADLLAYNKPVIPRPDIDAIQYQRKSVTSQLQKKLIAFAEKNYVSFDTNLQAAKKHKLPGKLMAVHQTIQFLKQHPLKIFSGAGMGNFASKLAFRATGFGVAGGYPSKYIYINNDFKDNHLELYLYYFSKDMELHSLLNTPDSIYDQLLAEYGLAGILAFLFLYIGFFIRHRKKISYSIPLLIILLCAFATGYWFEQLSVVVLFELLFFADMKTNSFSYWKKEDLL